MNSNIMSNRNNQTNSPARRDTLAINPNDIKLLVKGNIEELNASLIEAKKLFTTLIDDANKSVNNVNTHLTEISNNQKNANKMLDDTFRAHANQLADNWNQTLNDKIWQLETAAQKCTNSATTIAIATIGVLIIMFVLNIVGIFVIKSTYNDINKNTVQIHQLLKGDSRYWYDAENHQILLRDIKEAQNGK